MPPAAQTTLSWSNAREAAQAGFRLRKAGDPEAAFQVFSAASERFPAELDDFGHPKFAKEAFRTLLDAGAPDRARSFRARWTAAGGAVGWSHVLLARHLARSGAPGEAVAAWRLALEEEPGHAEAVAYLKAHASEAPPPLDDLVPRMTAAELELLLRVTKDRARIVEFGCGGSTLALARNGVGRIDSVESDPAWVAKLRSSSALAGLIDAGRVGLHHADIGPVGPWGAPSDHKTVRRWSDYWMGIWQTVEPKSVSLVLVDGRFRVACALAAGLLCDDDCLIAIHDYRDRPHYHVVLEHLVPVAEAETLSVFAKRRDLDTAALLRNLLIYAFNSA
ncbi:hypothetical protein STVA_20530 [Allostella vacuolata]|nr:hypothetical protein STVA_20530 [Stella vacuolata]